MKLLLPLCLALLFIPSAQAGTLDINFENVEKYTDIDSGRDPQKRYTERVLRHMTAFFEEVAADLPEGDTLLINVTNIDLAGDTRMGTGDMWDVRIMTDLHSPWMTFEASVTDANGKTKYSASEKIRDFNYLSRTGLDKPFEHEQFMIQRWGKDLLAALN